MKPDPHCPERISDNSASRVACPRELFDSAQGNKFPQIWNFDAAPSWLTVNSKNKTCLGVEGLANPPPWATCSGECSEYSLRRLCREDYAGTKSPRIYNGYQPVQVRANCFERSAKPLYVSSILTRASKSNFCPNTAGHIADRPSIN